MRKNILFLLFVLFISCHTNYQVVDMRGEFVKIDSSFDSLQSPATLDFISSRKQMLAAEMSTVLGTASEDIVNRERSFNPLGNLIADVIKTEVEAASNEKIDFAVVNIGAIRCEIPRGKITLKQVYELLPFTNTLCVMRMKGSVVQELFEQIASRRGEGVSQDVLLTIFPEGELVDAKIRGERICSDSVYRVATIEYLAEGNDGMAAFLKATDLNFLEDITLRELFIRYVKELDNEGKTLNSPKDSRIIIRKTSL